MVRGPQTSSRSCSTTPSKGEQLTMNHESCYRSYSDTVDGRNPAPVEVGSLPHYLQGFINLRWRRISSINSMSNLHISLNCLFGRSFHCNSYVIALVRKKMIYTYMSYLPRMLQCNSRFDCWYWTDHDISDIMILQLDTYQASLSHNTSNLSTCVKIVQSILSYPPQVRIIR